MALKSVGGTPDPLPLWERPYIPIPKRVRGSDELEEPVSVRLTRSQVRKIRMMVEGSDHPELGTVSDFLQAASLLGLDYYARQSEDPELQRDVQGIIYEAEVSWLKAQRARNENILIGLEEELKDSVDKHGDVVREKQFRRAYKLLDDAAQKVLSDDLLERAEELLEKYKSSWER